VKVSPTFLEIIPSPSSGCAGGLVTSKLMTSFGATKPPAQPKDGDGISSRNVEKTFKSGLGCPSEKISLNSVAARASRF